MASGQETYETLWPGQATYKTEFADGDLTRGGFDWRTLATLDLSTNVSVLGAGYTLPEFSDVLVLIVDTTIGGAFITPSISINYLDKNSLSVSTTAQVIQGMPPTTSISIPLTDDGIVSVTALSRTATISGTIALSSADSISERFNYPDAWSAASPGL